MSTRFRVEYPLLAPAEGEWMPTGRCPFCKRDTIFETLNFHDRLTAIPQRQGIKNGTVSLARCGHPRCKAVVYREYQEGNDAIQIDMYPPIELTPDEELPPTISRSFAEALGTYANGHWNASAQACGRALQDGMALLKPDDVEQKAWSYTDLKKQIVRLVTDNKLPPSIGEWAQDERIVRNLASHGGAQSDFWADEQDATEMLEFAKWIFRYVFVLPKQLELRRKRLADRNTASQSGQGSNAP